MITLKDIAKELNLSTAAVSKALRNDTRISAKTRKDVERVAKKLGYVKSNAASSLATGVNNNIAFIYNQQSRTRPFFQDEVYASIFQGIEKESSNNQYHIFVKLIKKDTDEFVSFNQQIDGIIYAGEISENLIKIIKKQNVPLVMAGNALANDEGIDCVLPDGFVGVQKAIEYLVGLGHKKIGLLTVPSTSMFSMSLEEGYKKSLEKYSLKFKKEYLVYSNQPENGYDGMLTLMRLSDAPTAVIAYSDKMALGIVEAAKELGIDVPQRVSVISFNDTELLQLVNPKITTLRYDTFELGQTAFSLLLDRIKGKTKNAVKIMFPISLIERESCMTMK